MEYFAGSLCLDVCLANDAAEVVILLAKISPEIRAAGPDRIKSQGNELRPDLGTLQCRGEPAGDLGHRLLWRVPGRDQPVPELGLVVLHAGLGYSWHVRQRLEPHPCGCGERTQLA